jgi:hypothetical protein
MINTIAQLLVELKTKEVELLKQYSIIKHPPLIGDMYEGLTEEILNRAVFKDLNLMVCGGKIKNDKNEFSSEIDLMVVSGEQEKIPYTNKYICKIEDVIPVIEVKKNLFSDNIQGAYENLLSVLKVNIPREGEPYMGRLIHDAFTSICRTDFQKNEDLELLPEGMQMIYHMIRLEAFHPIRIVWGYNGFATEESLRKGFYNYLAKNITTSAEKVKKGFSPLSFPTQIICGNHTLKMFS